LPKKTEAHRPNYAALFLQAQENPRPEGEQRKVYHFKRRRMCAGYTRAGKPCNNWVRGDYPFCCKAHSKGKRQDKKPRKRQRCLGVTKEGVQCRNYVRRGKFCPSHKGQRKENRTPVSESAKEMRRILSARVVESIVGKPDPKDYGEYLLSEHWSAVKRSVRTAFNNRCQICNSKKDLHVHHRTYRRIGRELWADLMLLCKDCHHLFHGRMKE